MFVFFQVVHKANHEKDSFHIPFDTIMKYFDPKNEIKVDNLDVAQNIVTLDGSVHASFGAFGFVILRTNESDGSITVRADFVPRL